MAKNQTKKRGRTKLSYKKTWCWYALEGKVKAFTFLSSTSSSWIETEMNMTNTPIKYLTLWSPIRMKKIPMGGKYENMCLQLCTASFSTVVMKNEGVRSGLACRKPWLDYHNNSVWKFLRRGLTAATYLLTACLSRTSASKCSRAILTIVQSGLPAYEACFIQQLYWCIFLYSCQGKNVRLDRKQRIEKTHELRKQKELWRSSQDRGSDEGSRQQNEYGRNSEWTRRSKEKTGEVRSAATIFILKTFFEVGVSLASLLQWITHQFCDHGRPERSQMLGWHAQDKHTKTKKHLAHDGWHLCQT